VDPDFDPDFDPEIFDEIDQMIKVVNFAIQVQSLHSEGFSELWVKDLLTGRSKRIWVLSLPN
jgi:hypothetical protein